MSFLQRSAVFAPFRVRSYRFQWPADLLTSWAFEMETLILGWYVLVQSGSVLLLASYGALQYLGSILGPVFGVAGDRVGHRRVLSALRGSYAVLASALMAFAYFDALSPPLVLVIAFLSGLVRPSDMGVRAALIGASIPRDHLMAALGLSRVTSDSARVFGAMTGAGLFAIFGIAQAYMVVVAFYLIGMFLTLKTQPMTDSASDTPTVAQPKTHWRNLRDGLAYVWHEPALRAAMWVAFLGNLVGFPINIGLLPYVAKTIYGLNETGLGYLVASFAFGAMIGSICLSIAGARVRFARVMLMGSAGWFAMLLIFGWVQAPVIGCLTLLLGGFCQSLAMVPLAVILLRTSDVAYRGRVMGVRMLAIYSLPFGMIVSGALIERIGFPATTTLYAVIGLSFTMIIGMRWRGVLWPHRAEANGG